MMEVVWLKESTEDLKEIGRHIEKDDPIAAYRVQTIIKASGDSLQHHPELGRPGRVNERPRRKRTGYPTKIII